jgi:hypothetical protein
MKEGFINKFFERLEKHSPKITLVRGINNKEEYFEADAIFNVLTEMEEEEK